MPRLTQECANTLALPCGQHVHGRQTHALYGLRSAFDFDGGEEDVAHHIIAGKGNQGDEVGAASPQLIDQDGFGRLAEGLLVHYSDRFDLIGPLLSNKNHVLATFSLFLLTDHLIFSAVVLP